MRKEHAALAVVSLVASGVINFDSPSVESLVVSWLVFASALFLTLYLLADAVYNARRGLVIIGTLFFLAAVVVGGVSFFVLHPFLHSSYIENPPNHFRTNTFTSQCWFGKGGSVSQLDPWYYLPGCGLVRDDLIKVMKRSGLLEQFEGDCRTSCATNQREFCSETISAGGWKVANKVRCDYLVECANVDCLIAPPT